MCKFVNLPLITEVKHGVRQSLEVPSELYNINADGNCLFHALSYVITGKLVDNYITVFYDIKYFTI